MRADDDVCLAVFDVDQRCLDLRRRNESREHDDVDREVFASFNEILIVLLCKKRRGREHYRLSSVHHRLEHCPERDLGLAESDVAAKQPVHWSFGLHVRLDLAARAKLVLGLDEREPVLEKLLLLIVRIARKSRVYAPCRVYLEEVISDLLDRFLALDTCLFHSSPPRRESFGSRSPGPTYFCSESRFSGSMYKTSSRA